MYGFAQGDKRLKFAADIIAPSAGAGKLMLLTIPTVEL